MRRELFEFVEQIRLADKYVDVSLMEIQRELRVRRRCDVVSEVDVTDDTGHVVTAPVRLNVAGGRIAR